MIRGTIQYVRSPEVTAKVFQDAVRQANAAAVEAWESDYEPAHFTVAGGRKYGYQPRKGEDQPMLVPSRSTNPKYAGRMVFNTGYYWQKIRKHFGATPDVRTGASRDAARNIKITASVNRAVGTWPTLPRYFFQFRKDLNTPDKAAELTAITADEVTELAKVHERTVTAIVEANRQKSTTTIG